MQIDSQHLAVVVTGGAAGLGLSIARAFALQSNPVAIVDLSLDSVTAVAARLSRETGTTVVGFAADVTDQMACASAHDQIVEAIGPIGVLVNNAGINVPQKGRIEEIPHEDFQRMMDIHVGGAVNWCRLVIPAMRVAGFGRIVNMSSANGVQPVPHRYAYVTAKKALRGLTEALALDCARAGITVNAVAPGYILTETLKDRIDRGMISYDGIAQRTPVGRWGKPQEIADMVVFLARLESGFITGTTMCVDGGLTIRVDPGEDLESSPFPPSHSLQD